MKYIELDKAIGAVKGAWKFEVESPDNYRDIAVETLNLLPSVEVVRCRECKHYDPIDPSFPTICEHMTGEVVGDNYCSYGERRNE